MEPAERIIIKSRNTEEENVPSIPVIVAGDESGLPGEVAQLSEDLTALTSVVDTKENKKVYVKLLEKTLEENSGTALDFTDYNFGSKFVEILIFMVGSASNSNQNILMNRNGVTSLQTIFGNMSRSDSSRYTIKVSKGKFVNSNGVILDTVIDADVGTYSDSITTKAYRTAATDAVDAINSLKVSIASGTFIAGLKVVVYGVSKEGATVNGLRETRLKKGTVDEPLFLEIENIEK